MRGHEWTLSQKFEYAFIYIDCEESVETNFKTIVLYSFKVI